ncbi:MAG TPA: KOW motif-containing protein [Pyrinomonadaceae bacterium]|nr:KOW motif-containing protein [Pyrinomonadaceae bacterium]
MIEPERFRPGEMVRIKRGPFAAFTGQVREVNKEKAMLEVWVQLFFVKKPLKVKFSDVEKIDFR